MAEYYPPTENLPIFDSSVFNNPASSAGITAAEAAALYLKRTGVATSTATTTSFGGVVQFDSALVIANGNQNTSLGNGFLPLAVGQGTQNVFVGVGAGLSALCGGGNTVCGYFAASQGMNATAAFNTLYGERAGQYLTSGVGNTCIGATNCNNNTTGNSNICLGYGAMAGESSGSLSNNIVIGNGIQSGASNRIILGDGTQTSMDLKVVSGSTVNMGGLLNMNDVTLSNRRISATVFSIQDYTTGVISGEITHKVGSVDIVNAGNGGSISFYVDDGIGTQLNPLSISSSAIQLLTATPLKFGNSTEQITAYTGGTAGTYTNTNMTIDANGKISAIASGTAPSGGSTTQLVQVGGYNAATGLAFPSPVSVTVPANAQYADIFLAGEGGYAGQGGDRSAGGYYTGGAGGGACAAFGRIFCKGLSISISKSLGVVTLTVGGIGIIDVASGSGGGGASPSAGGPGGIATTTAPSIYQPGYSSWFTYTGTAGGAGQANNPPTVGAIKYTGYNASALLGCGQQISTSGGANPYAFQTTYFGGAIITFYTT